MRTSLLTSLAVLLALAGCAGATTGDKGGEDYVPLDGKADSFRDPTEHGALRYDTASRAEITDDEKFHAWTFAISGDAQVDIAVESSDRNLDTVMYLYRKGDTGSWGRYIARNDDDGDRLQSRITEDLTAGEYRIIVKGFKSSHRGALSVTALCTGPGCADPDPGDGVVVPPATGFTTSCVTRLWESVGSSVVSGAAFAIHPDERSGHDMPVLVANAHYSDLSDWDEYIHADDRADFTFDVEYTKLENGFLVEMADGGDESTTDYVFDADGNLLAYFVHNQSPWFEFYCGVEGDEDRSGEEPDEDCLNAWMNHGSQDPDTRAETTASWVPGDDNDGLDAHMLAAVARYQETELDGDTDVEISIESVRFEGSYDETGTSELLLSGDGGAVVSYAVVDHWDGPIVVFESSENDDEGPHMICIQ